MTFLLNFENLRKTWVLFLTASSKECIKLIKSLIFQYFLVNHDKLVTLPTLKLFLLFFEEKCSFFTGSYAAERKLL